MRRVLTVLLLWTPVCTAQYVTNAVGSSSSAINVLAPEMLATVQGYIVADFVGDSIAVSNNPPPLSHVLIRPAGSMTAIPATITASDTFLVPAGIPTGTAELIWQFSGEPYQSIDVTIAPYNFELSRNGPFGSAAIPSVGLATPARPGQTIPLTGSGLGFGTQVTATIGGLPASVLYAGRGNPAGMDLIQLQIPTGVADGCYVPLVLNVGQSLVISAISVTSMGAPCQHPLNLSLSDLENLDAGGILNVVSVSLSTQLNAPLSMAVNRQESAEVEILPSSPAQVAQIFIPFVATGCTASGGGNFFGVLEQLYSNPVPQPPNPGASLTFTNSAGTFYAQTPGGVGGPYYTVALSQPQDGTLASPPASATPPGKWTLSTPGSPDLPPSTFSFNVPAPVQLSGGAPLTFSRNQSQTLTWNGAGFDPAAIAQVSLSGSTQFVSCAVPAQAGSATIPAPMLAPFAANTIGTLSITVTPGPAATPGTSFRTTSGIPLAFVVGYTTSDTRPVDFQ